MKKHKTVQEAWSNYLHSDRYTPYQLFYDGWQAKTDSLPSKRSNQQNRYYWGVLCKLASDHTGYTLDEIHEFHKENFRIPDQFGHWVIVGDKEVVFFSTKNMTTVEFNKWVEEKLIPFWAQQDVYIPLPNEPELWKSIIAESER